MGGIFYWHTVALVPIEHRLNTTVGLLDYGKNHNHDYFGQYCNHDYLKRLLVGHMTKTLCERFKDSDVYQIYIFCK